MMDQILFARDILEKNFVLISAEQTISQTRGELERSGVGYGVVVNAAGEPVALINAKMLEEAPDPDLPINTFSTTPAFVVSSETLLDETVSYSAQTFVENPGLQGLIVEEGGEISGILSRKTIRFYAQQIAIRGGDITELAGVPQTRAKYFICPQQDYKKLVTRYDPDDPPTCPTHKVALVEQP